MRSAGNVAEAVGDPLEDVPRAASAGHGRGDRDAARRRRGRAEATPAQLEGILEGAGVAIVTFDAEGRILHWSAGAERLFGWPAGEAVGHLLRDTVVPPGLEEAHRRVLRELLPGPGDAASVRQLVAHAVHRDGRPLSIEIAVAPVRVEDGTVVLTALARDISDRAWARRARATQFAVTRVLAEAATVDEAAARVVRAIGEGFGWSAGSILLVDEEAGVLRPVHSWHRRSADAATPPPRDAGGEPSSPERAFSPGEGLPGRAWSLAVPQTDEAPGGVVEIAFPAIHEGSVRGVVAFSAPRRRVLDDRVMSVVADLGAQVGQFLERKRIEAALASTVARLESMAETDALSGLANRRAFERHMRTPRAGSFGVLAIDMDNLKAVNDTHGHDAGDEALRTLSGALHEGMRAQDVVARIGGDEFGVLLHGADLDESIAIAERLRMSTRGLAFGQGEVRVSVGVAAGRDCEPLAVWSAADAALFRAKRAGRDRLEVARPEDHAGALPSRRRTDDDISRVIEGGRLHSVFQPVVDLRDRSRVGFEALARPDIEDAGDVEPLFAAADRLGRARDLDWACRRVALRDAAGLPPGALLLVNIGSALLLDPLHDVDQMLLLLRWAGRPPGDTVLEITEREFLRDVERLTGVVAAYREHGFRFALDHVGGGHSSLEVLAAVTPEVIKVAGSLVARAAEPGPRAAIEALRSFAASTGALLVAEGIESAEAAEAVLALGVTLGQGFALGAPAPAGVWNA